MRILVSIGPALYVMTPQFLLFHVLQMRIISVLETHVQYDPLWTCMTVTVV
jgi:hypothetical protein